jgi:hypothetical protein
LSTLATDTLLSPDEVVRRAIFLASINKDDLVCVAGPHGLDAMVGLCRAGYERVECAVRATCGGADEACDLLLIAGPMKAQALAEIVGKTGRLLRDGGVLIVQPTQFGDEDAIRPALAALGLEIAFTLNDRVGGQFVMFTVRRRLGFAFGGATRALP